MSLKRRNTSSPEPEDAQPPRKRRSLSPQYYEDGPVFNKDEKQQLNAETGQVGAFPGLGGDDSDELFYGPANDGIEYLRMVRSEARGVPGLLVAKKKEDVSVFGGGDGGDGADGQDEDMMGYVGQQRDVNNGMGNKNGNGSWVDGVYTAPSAKQSQHKAGTALPAAQQKYYEILLAQFRVLQATLRCTPPLEAVKTLGEKKPISFPANSKTARKAGERQIFREEPRMVQLACMDTESWWELLGLMIVLIKKIGQLGEKEKRRVGAWVWGVLGKAAERGEMVSEEVARLRELGVAAGDVLRGVEMDDGDMVDEEELDQMDEITEALENARKRSIDADVAECHDTETSTLDAVGVTCDIILTVVGEVYGQRDLLDLMPRWTVEEAE